MSDTQRLYPKRLRTKASTAHRRWQVRYEDMVYESGVSSSWTAYYRTRWGARVAAWWHQRVASYGGSSVTLTKQQCGSRGSTETDQKED